MTLERLVREAVDWGSRLPAGDARRLAKALLEPHGLSKLHATATGAVSQACAWFRAQDLDPGGRALSAGALMAALQPHPRHAALVPVWTGPESGVATRLTSAVVVDLIGRAEQHLLLVGYAVHNEPNVSVSLHAAHARGVDITLLVENSQDNQSFTGGGAPFPGLDAVRLRWPLVQRPTGGSLHAKLLVVDDREALVGSANVTGAALGRNLECGLLVRGGSAPRELRGHVLRLLETGHLVVAG